MFGAGCWATRGLACSVSGSGKLLFIYTKRSFSMFAGAGEHITRTMLARAVGDKLCVSGEEDPHEVLRGVLVDVFWSALAVVVID